MGKEGNSWSNRPIPALILLHLYCRPSATTMTLTQLLRPMEIPATVHGFGSSLRDWVANQTETPSAVPEAALAHSVGNPTDAAYMRSDLFERRRELMRAWGVFCAG